jgi:MFS transporter, DHA1 family, multidrug resistance protein
MMQKQATVAVGDEVQGTQKELTGELLFLLAGLAALGALATNIILPAFPDMAIDLGTSVIDLSATLSSFFVAFAVGQLFVGPLSDRFGRRWLVLSGLAAFVMGSAICAFASTLPQLIGGRVVQALGVCATSVLSRAIARDLFDGEALARALSLIMVAMAAAPGFSPLLGGALNSCWAGSLHLHSSACSPPYWPFTTTSSWEKRMQLTSARPFLSPQYWELTGSC